MSMYCVYCITNKINNKSYIGLTSKLDERWNRHIYASHGAVKWRYPIHHSLAKYGQQNFTWQVLENHKNFDDANEAEEFYISYLRTLCPNGYNIKRGGNNHHPTAETKKKISDTLKKTSWFIGRKGKDHPNFGRTLSEDHKAKLRNKNSGKNGTGAKLNPTIVLKIYIEYLNDSSIYPSQLAIKYCVSKNTIRNILKKKSWKATTKHLADINLIKRSCARGAMDLFYYK